VQFGAFESKNDIKSAFGVVPAYSILAITGALLFSAYRALAARVLDKLIWGIFGDLRLRWRSAELAGPAL
jgi:hypothetical protein